MDLNGIPNLSPDQIKALLSTGYNSPVRTVWTDIDAELEKCSADERNYVLSDSEYQQANETLKNAFYAFIEHTHRDEFLRHDQNGYAEKKLFALKLAKERYAQLSQSDTQILNDPEVQALIAKKREELNGR